MTSAVPRARPSSVVVAELTKLVRRPGTWVLLGLWPSLQLTFAFVIPYVSYKRGEALEGRPPATLLASLLPERLVENAIAGLPLFGGALLLTLGALVAGSEYGWGTLKTVLVQGPGRLAVLAGQLLALLVILAGTVAFTYAVNAVVSALIASTEGAAISWPSAGELAGGFGSGLLISMTWAALGVLLGTALRGTALAVGLGLVWVLAIENLVVNVAAPLLSAFQTVADVLPGVNAGSLVAALAGPDALLDTPGVAAVVAGPQAAWVLVGYLALFTILSGMLLSRRDVI